MGSLLDRLAIKNTSLAWRIFALFVGFTVVSGTLGPMIIGHSLVGKYGFEIYGGSGKALLFAAISFGFLAFRTSKVLGLQRWSRLYLLWLLVALGFYIMAFCAVRLLWTDTNDVIWPLLAHIGIVGCIAALVLATIGFEDLRQLWRVYRRELLVSLALGVGYYIFLELIYGLWEYLSTAVMHSVRWLLTLGGLEVYIIPPRTLLLSKFAVEISQFCSGIESIALFSGLYLIVGLVDRDRIDARKYLGIFLPALILLFACNILRVYVLILAAYFISPRIAFSLFHTYAGMIFFIVYSAVFWRLFYGWMLKKPATTGPPDSR